MATTRQSPPIGPIVASPRASIRPKAEHADAEAHATGPPPARTSLWAAVQTDWKRHATQPDAHQHLAAWKQTAPQLQPYDSPAALLQTIGQLGHPEQSCRLLSGLLLAAEHDPLAAHTVLIALIPGLQVAAGRRWHTARHDGPWTSRPNSTPTPSAPPGKPSPPTPANHTPDPPAASSDPSSEPCAPTTTPTAAAMPTLSANELSTARPVP